VLDSASLNLVRPASLGLSLSLDWPGDTFPPLMPPQEGAEGKDRTLTAMLVGAAAGAVLLGIPAAVVIYGMCSDPDSGSTSSCELKAAGGVLLGAGIGWIIGALVGSLAEP